MSLDLSRSFNNATFNLPSSMEAQRDFLPGSFRHVHIARLVSAERDGYFGRVVTDTFLHQVAGGTNLSIAEEFQPIC